MWESLKAKTTTCVYCPNLCLHACPVANAERRTTVAPFAKMSAVHWVAQGKLPLGSDVVELFFKCTECMACTDACVQRIDVAAVLREARQAAVATGVHAHPRSVFGSAEEALVGLAEVHALPANSGPVRTLFVPGCEVAAQSPGEVALGLRLLEAIGEGPVALASSCCGYLQAAAGFSDVFVRKARELAATVPATARVVAGSGACQRALTCYKDSGVAVGPVVSLVEVLERAVHSSPRRLKRLGGTVAVFDGCTQLRRQGLMALVRRVLERVVRTPVVELRWQGSESHCCGAGGAYRLTSPEGAAEAGRRIAAMAAEAGANTLVTFDSSCAVHLQRQVALAAHEEGIIVLSGLEVVARALGLREAVEASRPEVP